MKKNSHRDDVSWQSVLEESADDALEEKRSSDSIGSFPEKLNEEDRGEDNVQTIRASVYLGDDDEDVARTSAGVKAESALPKVNSKSRLLEMMGTDGASPADPKLCHGPDLSPIRGTSPLTTFAHDVERDLLKTPAEEGFRFESDNSLDIERELNELMGTLRFPMDGSEVNLAYERTEREENAREREPENYWSAQRQKSKSFIERCRFLRNGRQRMSMFEFGNRKRSSEADAVIFEPRQPRFVRLACDRSSVVEPRVSSLVSLPARPQSAQEGRKLECSSAKKAGSSSGGDRISLRTR